MAKFTHLSENPILSVILRKNYHSTLSYALLMSSLIVIWPTLPCLLFLSLCSISYATKVLSEISLFGTKALWESEMMLGRIGLTQLAKTFETILLTMLLKLMGR